MIASCETAEIQVQDTSRRSFLPSPAAFALCPAYSQCIITAAHLMAERSRVRRRELISHLIDNGASLVREGRRHSIYGKGKYRTEVPRHTEIVDELARKICRDLDIPFPGRGR